MSKDGNFVVLLLCIFVLTLTTFMALDNQQARITALEAQVLQLQSHECEPYAIPNPALELPKPRFKPGVVR